MIICLIRHAKSDWSSPELKDIDRPLNKRGYSDAPVMSKRLKEKGVSPEIILSSTAVRAYTTARIFAEELSVPENKIILREELYDSTVEIYKKILKEYMEHKTLFLFGHNPTITMLVNELGDLQTDNVPTCGMAAFEFTADETFLKHKKGKLLFYDYPKRKP